MAAVTKWNWQASNGTATADATKAAYNALRHGGRTAVFTYPVWNDILNKISAQRRSWGDTAWLTILVDDPKNKYKKLDFTLADTRMSRGAAMTANRFNAAVKNMPTIREWPWKAELGRTEIKSGDRCYGAYFIMLTDALNHWIDTIPIPLSFTVPMKVVTAAKPRLDLAIEFAVDEIKIRSKGSALVHPDPSIRFGGIGRYYHSFAGTDVSLLIVADTGINVFYHVNYKVKAAADRSIRTVFNGAVKLDAAVKVGYGGCDFVVVNLPVKIPMTGILRTSGITELSGATDFLVTTSMKFGFGHRKDIVAGLPMKWFCEPRIEELDSEPFAAEDKAVLSITAPVVAPKGSRIRANLVSTYGSAVKAGVLKIAGTKVNLPLELSIATRPALLSWGAVRASLTDAINVSLSAVRAVGAHTGADLGDSIAIKFGVNAFDQLSTGAEIALQSIIQAAVKAPDAVVHAVRFEEAVDITTSVCVNDFAEFGVDLKDLLNTTAAPVLKQGAHTGADLGSLTDIKSRIIAQKPTDTAFYLDLVSEIKTDIGITTDLAPIKAELDATCENTLFLGLADNSGSLRLFFAAHSTASATVGLNSVCGTAFELQTSHIGNATASLDTAIEFKGELHAESESEATFGLATYTLASELEDVLVSDLDEILVTDVEFTIH